jgi:hypothetical protein
MFDRARWATAALRPVLERLHAWCGNWEGEGRGEFPTLAPFSYRELLVLTANLPRGFVRFEQWAWKRPVDGGPESASHHEVGAMVADADGLVLSTIQNGTRYERLRGVETTLSDGLQVDWRSEADAADPRLVRSTRQFRWSGDTLTCEMSMELAGVQGLRPHLKAVLRRG